MSKKDYSSELSELLDYHFWSLDKSKQTNRLSIEEAKVKLSVLLRRVEVEARIDELELNREMAHGALNGIMMTGGDVDDRINEIRRKYDQRTND